jgi:hypothetical protein
MATKSQGGSKHQLLGLGMVLVLSLGAASCLKENVCGKEMTEKDGLCVYDAGINGDAGDTNEDAGEATLPTGMNDSCTTSADCALEADYCLMATYPDPSGYYCTTQGCDVALNDCPLGYECLDLSESYPSLPTACVIPTDAKKQWKRLLPGGTP